MLGRKFLPTAADRTNHETAGATGNSRAINGPPTARACSSSSCGLGLFHDRDPIALIGPGEYATPVYGDEPVLPTVAAVAVALVVALLAIAAIDHVHPVQGADAEPTAPGSPTGGPGDFASTD